MRASPIVLVAHRFPPQGHAGVEQYTLALASELARRGREVTVVTGRSRPGAAQYSVTEERVAGLRVQGIVQNWPYRDLPEAVRDPALDRVFGELLATLRPGIVAFQSLQGLSWGMPMVAKQSGARVALHLHDADASCASGGQRQHPDGSLCLPVDRSRCGACFDQFRHREGALERGARWLAQRMPRALPADGLHRAFAALPPGAKAVLKGVNGARRGRGEVAPEGADPRIEARVRSVAAGLGAVDRVISPSRFLAESLGDDGVSLPGLRIVPTGTASIPASPLPPRAPLRVLLLGTWAPHKGQQVLGEALARLDGVEALAVGPTPFPAYRDAAIAASRGRLRAQDAVAASEVPRLLAAHHVVVIPSTWAENAPLVALEARAAGRPVVASDLGGLRELVEEGVDGLRFAAGDPEALAAALRRLRDEEGLLGALRGSLRPPPGIVPWVDAVLEAWA